MNGIVTLGIGSFVQGDYIGGGALLGSQVLGGMLVITGMFVGQTQNAATAIGFTPMRIGYLTITALYSWTNYSIYICK
ncbi:hypothetical protein HNQ06_001028 [Borrelia lanei]|uniref:Uncharacterized protein n=1 Tax=Borreliella lanei TaxID=373540 RepID=A0A7W9ZC38_9SPIR|nr:hypothetical protein [Borreliella lanei]